MKQYFIASAAASVNETQMNVPSAFLPRNLHSAGCLPPDPQTAFDMLRPPSSKWQFMLNRAIEIHDSILASVSILQGRAELRFSRLYIHQAGGEPGRDSGSVWVQEAILRISDVDVNGAFSEFPVDLDDGETRIGDCRSENVIPIPLPKLGAFEIRLEAWRQAQEVVTLRGNGAQLELIGNPEYVEEFRP